MLKSEVISALANLNLAAGLNEIIIVMLAALDDFDIHKIAEIIYDIYESCDIPKELNRSIFIALPRNPGAKECELHWTI